MGTMTKLRIGCVADLASVPRDADGRLDLRGADLSWSNLRWTNLGGAVLSGAKLVGTYLVEADLRGAVLVGTNLRGAVLRKCLLRGASLFGADLLEADLSRTNLRGVDLSEAVLRRAILQGTNFGGANLGVSTTRARMLRVLGARMDITRYVDERPTESLETITTKLGNEHAWTKWLVERIGTVTDEVLERVVGKMGARGLEVVR